MRREAYQIPQAERSMVFGFFVATVAREKSFYCHLFCDLRVGFWFWFRDCFEKIV
jgi:hypothetical protein